jgi:MoxR-like ATPase
MKNGRGSPKKDWDPADWAGVKSEWDLARKALAKLDRVLIWGPPGIGKSHLAFEAAGNAPVSQVTLSEDLTVQELSGHWVPDQIKWLFNLGPVTSAYKYGGILILNEISRASAAVQNFLLGVLDSGRAASIALPNGEILSPAPGYKVVATSNSNPDELDPALRSRFEAEIHLSGPNPSLIDELNQRCPGLGDALMDSYKDPQRALDPRRVFSFLDLIESGLPPRQAAVLTFGERAPDFLSALHARGVNLCDTF